MDEINAEMRAEKASWKAQRKEHRRKMKLFRLLKRQVRTEELIRSLIPPMKIEIQQLPSEEKINVRSL